MIALLATLAFIHPQGQVEGAEKMLRSMGVVVSVPAKETSFARLRRDVDKYIATSDQMTPKAAADVFMKLLAEWRIAKMDPGAYSDDSTGSLNTPQALVEALPRPEVWPEIRARLAKEEPTKKGRTLVLLFDVLLGNDKEVMLNSKKLRENAEDHFMAGSELVDVELPAAMRSGSIDDIVGVLDFALKQFSAFFFEGFPDLVHSLGEAKARQVLNRVLPAMKPDAVGHMEFKAQKTRELARAVVLENLERIPVPLWQLGEDEEYVLALVKRFGTKDIGYNQSKVYLTHLLKTGQVGEAVKLLSSSNHNELSDPNLLPQVQEILRAHPELPLWPDYFALAKMAGELPRMKEQLDAALAAKDIQPLAHQAMLIVRGDIYGLEGEANLALKTYMKARGIPVPQQPSSAADDKALSLASLLDDLPALALLAAKANSNSADDLVSAYVSTGRLGDAQKLLLKIASTPSVQGEGGPTPEIGVQLAEVYFAANRPQDIIGLLDGYPGWTRSDLFDLLTLRTRASYRQSHWGKPLGFLAAWAFALTGKKSLASKVVRNLLRFDMRSDEAYELLNQVEGAAALPFYDELIRTDPLQPRTLAWKADALRISGKLDDAEVLARKAVAMDPTDGDAAPGQRLSSYSILAKILTSQGMGEEASRLESIVKAVRVAEQADRLKDAGLIPQALKGYDEASAIFRDAYCIEARKAIALAETGKFEEAARHYRRAYELMPASFGRVESFCFGCTGLFFEGASLKLARMVFEQLLSEQPDNPQTHYLLAETFEDSEPDKAAAHLKEAVRLDPLYFNALLTLVSEKLLPPGEAEEVAFRVVRIDPLTLHRSHQALGSIRDYRKLWNVFDQARKTLPPQPNTPLYPMPKRTQQGGFRSIDQSFGPGSEALRRSAGAALGEVPTIRSAASLYFSID